MSLARSPEVVAPARLKPAKTAQLLVGVTPEPDEAWTYFVYTLIVIGFAVVAYFQLHAIVMRVLSVTAQHGHIRFVVYPSVLWMAMGFLLLLFRTAVWTVYRPAPPASAAAAPSPIGPIATTAAPVSRSGSRWRGFGRAAVSGEPGKIASG